MPTFVNGSALDDILYGVDEVDLMRGLGGNDTMVGSPNRSGTTLDGGDGDDNITLGYTFQAPTVRGSSGFLFSPQGNTAIGGAGNDRISGGLGDVMIGGAGDDVIGAGYPIYFGTPNHLPGRVEGGDGNDTISVYGAMVVDAGSGADRITIRGNSSGDDGVSTLRTGAGADLIELGSTNAFATRVLDFTVAGPERDTIQASSGNTLNFLDGTHRLVQRGADTLIMRGTETTVVILENVRAADLTAAHLGGANPGSVIWTAGGRGDDVFTSGTGSDRFEGGFGLDTAVFSGNRADYQLTATGRGVTTTITDLRSGTNDGVDTVLDVEILRFADQSVLLFWPQTAPAPFRYVYDQVADFSATSSILTFATGASGFDFTGLGAARVRVHQDFDLATVSMIVGGTQVQASAYGYVAGSDLFGLAAGVHMTGTDDWADAMVGGALGDRLYGFDGDDSLSGLAGDDGLMGGLGADRLTGGAGADVFVYSSVADSTATASDTITDFQTGVDRIDLSSLSVSSVSIVAEGGLARVSAQTATGVLSLLVSGTIAATDLVIGQGAAIVGTTASETLTGTMRAEVVTGGRGADLISGGYGADVFRYLAVTDSDEAGSDDILDFETGIDRLDLTALGTTAISLVRSQDSTLLFGTGAAGSFRIASLGFDLNGSDIDFSTSHGVFMAGSAGADAMQGTSRADQLVGGGGNDVLTGGGGGDTLTGGAGADTFRYLSGSDSTAVASDIITEFVTGSDRIDLTAMALTSVSVARLAGGASVVFAETAAGAFQLFVAAGNVNATDIDTTVGVFMIGSDSADTMIGSHIADPMIGGAGDDILTGGIGADAISGGAGRDTYRYVSFMDSSSTLGVDNLYDFTTGEDVIDIRPLSPSTFSSAIQNITILRTEDGSSILFAGGSSIPQFATSAVGRDINAQDVLFTSAINGPYGITMLGATRSETMIGGALGDNLYGRDGDDVLVGGGGGDGLYGEGGSDTFLYRAASESTVALSDIIFSFVSGTDKIDLRQVRTGPNDAFGIAYSGGFSYLFVDLGGDGVNDMRVILTNTRLEISDILWAPAGMAEETPIKMVRPEVLPVEASANGADVAIDLSGRDGRFMLDLDLDVGRGFHHGQDWYL